MRISEAFCKMRLSEYCTSQDVDRAIAVTVDSFVGGQKVSCKKALARAFAKYVFFFLSSSTLPAFPFPLSLFSSIVNFIKRKRKRSTNEISNWKKNRYTLSKPGSQRSQNGRNGFGGRTGAPPATAVMA